MKKSVPVQKLLLNGRYFIAERKSGVDRGQLGGGGHPMS